MSGAVKLPQGAKPSLVLGDDDGRPRLQGALLLVEKGQLYLYATNAYSMVRLALGRGEAEPGPVPKLALKHLEQGRYGEFREKHIQIGIASYDRVISENLPDTPYDKYPSYAYLTESKGGIPTGDNCIRLGLNPKLLIDLARAMGSEEEVELVLALDRTKDMPEGTGGGRYYTDVMHVLPREDARQQGTEGLFMPRKPEAVSRLERI